MRRLISLRIDAALADRATAAAKAENRSLGNWIETLVDRHFKSGSERLSGASENPKGAEK